MTKAISNRGKEQPASPMRRLEAPYLKMKDIRSHIYPLNIGQPDIETPPSYMDVYRNFPGPTIKYGPSGGLPEYRKILSDYYAGCGISLTPDEILVTTGGSEAIIFVFAAITDPGDEVIVPEPFYANYNGFANMVGSRIIPVTSRAETGYALPPISEVELKISPRTRAIMICNPGNPTGYAYTKEEISALKALCLKHDIFLVSDEVYREFVYDGKHHSILSEPGFEEHGIIVDSLSKRFSLCGARLGQVASHNKDVIDAILKMGQARLCPPTVEQYAAMEVHKLGQDYFDGIRKEYQKRRDTVYDGLMKIDGVFCKKPRGAFYIQAKLPVADTIEFAHWLLTEFELENETVLVAPGNGFYATKDIGLDEIRIAYIIESGQLARAMHILGEGLRAYPGRK
ncbi:MAG: pyridoxal phosphate-dependent aminotransferase [Acidobacteria bacterium]|nr:pyridoxal phosphate-dependent aminotransferase [Acidobacteriota bacterium]